MNLTVFLMSAVMFLTMACGSPSSSESRTQEAWNPINAPENMGVDPNVHFEDLVRSAYLPEASQPWSGSYWPTFQAGIAQRWQEGNKGSDYRNYLYRPLAPHQAVGLNEQQLARLSPAEKYDLLSGDTSFSLTTSELTRVSNSATRRGIPTWWGLCHGWAVAAYMETEPRQPVEIAMDDGRQMTLYPDDLKALLTSAYANADVEAEYIGARCDSNRRRWWIGRNGSSACRDTNAGAFHLAITEYVGRKGTSLVAEVDAGNEVWNHPVIGYEFQYGRVRSLPRWRVLRGNVAETAVATVDVRMRLYYVVESQPGEASGEPLVVDRDLRYKLEIDPQGRVVGGEWQSNNQPDFLWKLVERPEGVQSGIDLEVVRGWMSAE